MSTIETISALSTSPSTCMHVTQCVWYCKLIIPNQIYSTSFYSSLYTPQTLKKLLFEIEDHNALDCNGDAPLHCYVKRRDKEKFNCLITFLIHSKCDVNLLNIDGQTALHLACKVSDYSCIPHSDAMDILDYACTYC